MARKKTTVDQQNTAAADAPPAEQHPATANASPPENQSAAASAPPAIPNPDPEASKRSWQPWSSISTPLTDEAKADFRKGPVARYIEGYNSGGVGVSLDHPDPAFRPSQEVIEPLKEEHKGHNRFSWRQALNRVKVWHKPVRDNPIAERLDGESRYAETVKRARDALKGPDRS